MHGAYVHRHVVCMQQLTLHPCPPPPTKKFQIQVPHKIIILSNDYIYKKKRIRVYFKFWIVTYKSIQRWWTYKWNMLYMWFYKQLFNFIENFNLFFTSFNWATEQHIACSLRYSSSLYHLSHYTLGQKHFSSSIPFIQSLNINESAPQKLNTPLCSQLDNKTGYIYSWNSFVHNHNIVHLTQNIPHYDHVFFSLQPRIQNMSSLLCIRCP